MLEYFIATPGARKGLVDTALRTADSGYLTRRLVDVAQELIINERGSVRPGPDGKPRRCAASGSRTSAPGPARSSHLPRDQSLQPGPGRRRQAVGRHRAGQGLDRRARTRWTRCATIPASTGSGCCRRSPTTPRSASRAACYGLSLATGKTIETGEAVGVIAAQSIGEPGTQLTMRTFHTGGIAGGGDIAGGLPRVVELFEARSPKGKATLSRRVGRGAHRRRRGQGPGGHRRRRRRHRGDATRCPSLARLEVTDGQEIHAGDAIVEGPRDPKELLEIKGVRETQAYLVERGPEGLPRPGRAHPRQAHRADRAPDDPTHRRAGAGRLRLPAGRAGRPEGVHRHQPGPGDRGQDARPRAGPSSWASPRRRWPPIRGCRRPRSRRPPGCSPRPPSSPAATRCSASRRTSSSASSSRPARAWRNYRDIATFAPDYQPMEFYSSADEEQDIAEWLAGRSDGGRRWAPRRQVIDLPTGDAVS